MCEQVRLKERQAQLQARLKAALNLTKVPRSHVDTATVADKAVAICDQILEVSPQVQIDDIDDAVSQWC